jgi:hypothetical protein
MCSQEANRKEKVEYIKTILDDQIPPSAYRLLLLVFILVLLSFGTMLW